MTIPAINLIRHWPGYVLVVVYLVSGGVSLAYEILWTRMLSLQFGVSIFGVVATVAAFMFGLGAGSFLGIRWAQYSKYPLRLFALLEFLVAVSAFVIPSLFRILDEEFSSIAANVDLTMWLFVQITVVMIVLMLPALAMGAGFPLVLAAIKNSPVRLGAIYGVNAIGGAMGALLPLLLLPVYGWLISLYCIAGIGILTAISALLLSRWIKFNNPRAKQQGISLRPSMKWLLVYGGIGAAALLLEIGWTRLFGMVLLRTEYVLAIILAVFLLGIGLGSLAAKYLSAKYWLVVLPIIASLFAILSLWWFPELSSWAETEQFTSLIQALIQQGLVVAMLTLPVTLVLGAWLPLFAMVLGDQNKSAVWLYGANSIGAGMGTLLAGFVLIPTIGSAATIVCGSMLLLMLGLAWGNSPRAWFAVIIVGIAAAPVLEMPEVSELMPTVNASSKTISLHEDAIAITHVVEREDGQRQLLADLRRMDASSDPTAVTVQMNQVRLPMLLHPDPKNVLFLGLGTGISASASLSYPNLDRTAIELSLGAIRAAGNEFRQVNGNIVDKMRIVRDDVRHYLMSDSARYDVIIGDLFHPDLVGRSALLSVQQFRRTRERLSTDGVFVQWLALNQFDLESLRIVLRSFRHVYPEAVMFVDAFRLAMVGTRDVGVSAESAMKNMGRFDDAIVAEATGGEGLWTWMGRYWGSIPESVGEIQDEWAPVIEYRLPGSRYNGDLDLSRLLAWLLTIRPAISMATEALRVANNNRTEFEGAYAATELAHRSWLALLQNQQDKGQQLLPLAYQSNPRDRWVGFALADAVLADQAAARQRGLNEKQLLEAVLKIRPDHTEALRGLWHLSSQQGEIGKAEAYRARLATLSPFDRELKAVH